MKWLQHPYFTKGLHVLIWLLLLTVPALMLHGQDFFHLPPNYFLYSNLFHIALFYFNAYWLYPKLMTRRRWPLYPLALIALFALSYRIKMAFIGLYPAYPVNEQNQSIVFFPLIPFFIASIIYRLVIDKLAQDRKAKELKTERLDSELKFLRSQVSPHFLFNMLTNMVALARQQSPLLESSLIRLSELLRYMLYDSAEGKITLAQEIEYINNYVALQQLRFGDQVTVVTNIKNDSPESELEPMLLVPFIENAFKHGIGLVTDPYIRINLQVQEKKLQFSVENNYQKGDSSKDRNKGIGVENVKHRLELLYPKKYELLIKDDQQVFSVHLKLAL